MTQIVSSISGLPIYAPSAAYAPTNGVDVSAVASAYAESAASGKQDAGSYLSSTDASAFYPSTANPSGYLTTLPADLVYSADLSSYAYESSNSAKLDSTAFSTVSGNFLTSETVTATAGDGTYVTSINGMGFSGAGGGGNAFPVTYNSGNVSAELTTGYFAATNRPSLIISSTSSSVYPRFIVTNGTDNGNNLRKGSYYLSDAFEFTTGSANNSGIKVMRVDPQQISSKNFLLYGPSGSTTYGTLALRGSDSKAYVLIGSGGVEHTNYVRPSAISSWWNVYDHVNSASSNWTASGLDSADVSAIASAYQVVSAVGDDGTYITSINGSALSGVGGGGIDSATCSAIASSYAESAVSSVSSNYLGTGESSNYYPTGNPSGFALSSDVSGTVDLVSAQSANWSTNADWEQTATSSPAYIENKPDLVDIVAGPGIVVDNPDGNTLRVSTDSAYETVLYAAPTDAGTTLSLDDYVTLSESMTHFERVRIYYALQKSWAGKQVFESYMVYGDLKVNLHDVWYREASGFNVWYETFTYNKYTDSNLRFTQAGGVQRQILNTTWNTTSGLTTIVYKIVGIHRIANN